MDKRLLLWLAMSTCLFVGLLSLRQLLLPPPKPAPTVAEKPAPPKPDDADKSGLTALEAVPGVGTVAAAAAQQADSNPPAIKEPPKNDKLMAFLQEADEAITLGEEQNWQIQAVLSKHGGAVRFIKLHKFEDADRKTALPTGKQLVLVSDDEDGQLNQLTSFERVQRQSYRLLVDGKHLEWKVNKLPKQPDEEKVVFTAEIPEKNARIIKTFTLRPDQYHLDLDVKLEPIDPEKTAEVTYELTGPQGVPVEGEYWRNTPYRQVVIGAVDSSNTLRRTLYDPSAIDPERANAAKPIIFDAALQQEMQYAGVMNQFFGAVTVLNVSKDAPAQTRPVAQVSPQYLGNETADKWTNKKLMGKITVNLTSRPVRLEKGRTETHSYLLYTGPVKAMLLDYEKEVRRGLADHYAYELHLNTLTDYPSDNWMSSFFYAIGWTRLLIFCTNVMHGLLELLHSIVPAYGVAIMLMTFLVRSCMFPISRKQAITMQKTQKLQPELAKLQEKYKDDFQQLAQAQRELYKKHGVNPASGCLIVLLQMPIFMGLYYALNESVHLRLAPFLWMENLAAPDMLFRWDTWPVIGGLAAALRLGPYFHLLPLISITLIIIQQKLTMPPPANDQMKMQMWMMNAMMYFMAYMFYWVAGGLCLYFTISGIWGMVERRLLPKKDANAPPGGPENKGKSETSPKPTPPTRGRDRESRNGEAKGFLNRLANIWTELVKKADKK